MSNQILSNEFVVRLSSLFDNQTDPGTNTDLIILLLSHLVKTKYDNLKLLHRLGAQLTPEMVVKLVLSNESNSLMSSVIENNIGIINNWNLGSEKENNYSDNLFDEEDFNDPYDDSSEI